MSLDVYLYGPEDLAKCTCSDCGHVHEVAKEPTLCWANITHNLSRMADAAGIYECVWRPDEHGMAHARDVIAPLEAGIRWMEANPGQCREFNAVNGWGTYEQFLPWLRRYLAACKKHPEARVRVSR